MIIILIIVGLSALILIHELGHFLAAKFSGIPVEEFGIGYPPRLISKKIGETRYSINLLPFGGFIKIYGEQAAELQGVNDDQRKNAFYAQPAWRRTIVLLGGVVMNFILGWFIFSSLFLFGTASSTLIITQVVSQSPAAQAGFLSGDEIIGFQKSQEFINFINENRGKEIAIKIKRDGKEMIINATPRVEIPAGQGALGLGIGQSGFSKLGFFASLKEGFLIALGFAKDVIFAIFNIFAGLLTGRLFENVVGPVGMVEMAGKAAKTGLIYFIQLLGFMSVSLSVSNIFPFPALDGGRLLFIVIEKIKGSPIKIQKEALVNAVGFALLFALMIAITIRDVVKLF